MPKLQRSARRRQEGVRIPADVDGDVATEPGGEANELLEREALEAAVAQVGHARLIGAQQLGGVYLRPALKAVNDGACDGFLERRDGVGWGWAHLAG
jgi:hypothetical protein